MRGLSGWVSNDESGVVLEAEGAPETVAAFLAALREPPALARVDAIAATALPVLGPGPFEVRISDATGRRTARVPADTATCPACLAELRDPADRRHGYAFTNCTQCGPRYTIVTSVPYDRARTTMAGFPLCDACRAEYTDPANRRFHAEPVCCPTCGPQLRLVDRAGAPLPGDPVAATAALLRAGAVVAVKGLGGYHLAVDAAAEPAVAALRSRKHREDRPFALMVPDAPAAEALCEIGPEELALLTSAPRPIVLLTRRADATVAPSVAPRAATLGLMLPYTPLHALLLAAFGGPLVLTSGNASDEPIAFDDGDALDRLPGIADAFLQHDRPIRTRVDDSVVRIVRGRPLPVRRSRGYVPDPVALPLEAPEPILACGAALKNTFCLARGRQAVLSHHIGDLANWTTLAAYTDGIAHLQTLLDVDPAVVAHDLHPEYPSTRYALDRPGAELIAVQHHHAHIASCLADNGVDTRVIGIAFDGLGLGPDGTAWGGEVLLADLAGYVRAAHLAAVPMPGGDAATRQPWRMAAAHLEAAYGGAVPAGLAVAGRQGPRWEQVLSAARAGVNAPPTSSAGRLFDAVAALIGVRDVVTYEGQAAIELEQLADPTERGGYPLPIGAGTPALLDAGALVRAVVEDLRRGTPAPVIAARFHTALADAVLAICDRLRAAHGLATVALSGGVFQNALLLCRCLDRLEGAGFTVLTHRQVPPNDGGLSLGQAAVAAAVLRDRR
ncbi:MAG: carbamoyltransferase HypF [Mycobacterium sp.]|nr:carbamoyltransferase HypF [Mycobacterium sp.]